jgi:hypothetical protein
MLQSQHEKDWPRDHRQSSDNATDAHTETASDERRENDKARGEKNSKGEHSHSHSLREVLDAVRGGSFCPVTGERGSSEPTPEAATESFCSRVSCP